MKVDLHQCEYLPFYKRISYLYVPALFVVTTVAMEIMMFILMGIPFPPAYIFSLSIVVILAAVIAAIQPKWLQVVICSLLLAGQLTTTIANVIANATCMEIFSLETLKTLGMAFGNAGAIEMGYGFVVPLVFLMAVYVVGVVLILWFCRVPRGYRRSSWHVLLCGVMAFVSFFSYNIAYAWSPNYERGADHYVENLSNQKFLYDTFSNRVASLRMFGSYSYYLDNFLSLLGGKAAMTDILELEVEDFAANDLVLNEDEVLGEGYNLIMVLMETFEREAINPVTMPNLYNFMLESCVEVDGFYGVERTCFSDHISQTGMMVAGKELWNNYGDVAVPHSLANVFKKSDGYTAAAFHDYSTASYNRGTVFTQSLGFDKFYDYTMYTTADERYGYCGLNCDELLFERNLDKIAPVDTNFYSYVISVSTHSLNASKYNLGDYYPQYFQHMDDHWDELTSYYPQLLTKSPRELLIAKNYLAGTYSFDLGFGELLHRLKTTKSQVPGQEDKLLIETTALVLFGDHYYYVNPDAIKAENDHVRDLAGNRSPLIIYNPRAKTKTGTTQAANAVSNIDKEPAARTRCGDTIYRFTSTMDLYPTVCSLFGVLTDQQMTYGHSIFETDENGQPIDSIGVAYLGGFTWGVTGHDMSTEQTTWGKTKANWHIWRTLNFVEFNGVTLTKDQIAAVTPEVNRVWASTYLNTSLFDKNCFGHLAKYKAEGAYHLGASKSKMM